jgi:hypothetical protein
MGVVYRATQLALNRRVAIKAIAPALAGDVSFQERFQRESQLTASIDHPNVIPVYGAGEEQGTLYLIMRWVEGTDLRRLLDDRGALPVDRAVRLLRPVAGALAAAHRRGLVHRDVKPANVLVATGEEGEHVYLTDFGIAQRIDATTGLTSTGIVVGTLDYTAPERLRGGSSTPESDIYSFGCMLYETVTGAVPFDRPTGIQRIDAHLNDPIPSARAVVPDLPPRLDAVIARAMAKDPADRFADAGELGTALEGVLAHPASAAPVPDLRPALAQPQAPVPSQQATAADGTRAARTEAGPTRAAEPQTNRRRPATLLALALPAAAGVIVAILLLGGGSSHHRTTAGSEHTTHAPAALVAHSPVALGGRVGAMSSDDHGTVWVSVPSKDRLVKIDASGPKAITVHGRPGALAALLDGVEVVVDGKLERFGADGRPAGGASQPSGATILTADRKDGIVFTMDRDGTIHRPDSGASTRIGQVPNDIAYGEGWLWLALSNGKLERLHRDLSPGGSFPDPPNPTAIAFNGGVWQSQANGHATRFDPRLHRTGVNADVPVAPGQPQTDVAALDSQPPSPFVWTISQATNTLYEVSYDKLKVIASLHLPSRPLALAAATSTSVWVATAANELIEVTAKAP